MSYKEVLSLVLKTFKRTKSQFICDEERQMCAEVLALRCLNRFKSLKIKLENQSKSVVRMAEKYCAECPVFEVNYSDEF